MKEEITRNQISAKAALVGGLIIAALSFSAGAVGARSHKVSDPATASAARVEVRSSASEAGRYEPMTVRPSDSGAAEKRVPGHSECDLQLD